MNGSDWNLSVAHFLLPKAGLLPSECEDAIALSHRQGRFCVADGATEAYDSRRWAKLLTRYWAASDHLLTNEEFEPWLSRLGSHLERRWSRKTLPWYAEEKARGGAFAAFVGLAFIPSENHLVWQAVALGDSCLIQIRDGSIVTALPISEPEAFGYHPALLPSNQQRLQGIGDQVTVASGDATPRDTFVLLTDAIAAWYLRTAAENPLRVDELSRLLDASDTRGFERFVERERADKSLRNDDIAVLKITIDAPLAEITAV